SNYFLSLQAGQTANSTLTLSSRGGFSGTVALTVKRFDPVHPTANPSTVTANQTQTSPTPLVTVTVPPSPPPTLTRFYVKATTAIGPDLSITAFPYFLSIPHSGSGNSTISLTSIDNLKGTATLFAQFSGPATVSPNSTTVALSPNSTSTTTFKFSTGVNVAPGYYYVDISASLGSITHDAYVSIQVTGPDFSIFSNPGSLTLQRGASGVSTIFLNSLDSFNGTISLTLTSYALTATPSNATQSLTPGGTASITITIQAPETTLPGTYYVLVDAISGNI